MNKFIFYKDNILTSEDCNKLIKQLDNSLIFNSEQYRGYSYCNIEETNLNIMKSLVLISNKVIKDYIKEYPEINHTGNQFALTNCRFKKFLPNNSFNIWHSEHCKDYSTRVLNIMYYLSDHNCGTEFYDGSVVMSKKGRVIVFPSYFTHTHRGQVCPDKKTRYILTGYFNFI